jgi:hypothetical protein
MMRKYLICCLLIAGAFSLSSSLNKSADFIPPDPKNVVFQTALDIPPKPENTTIQIAADIPPDPEDAPRILG